jgi:valyl-tRNA synthetase
MDTWAVSCLTPKIAMAVSGAPNLSMPFDARNSSHDIIRTWNFYTVAVSLLNDNVLPWKNLWINGFILDPDRKKMSKSKGNVVVPSDLVEKYGADAIRLWAASTKWGIDATADEKMMEQKRKLVNKFFNAAKFVFGIVGDIDLCAVDAADSYPTDIAYCAILNKIVADAYSAFSQHSDDNAALIIIEQGFWDFCDNYLEIAKGRAYDGDKSAKLTLVLAIETFCAVFAPFMPFMTEEIWCARPWGGSNIGSLHQKKFPNLWPNFASGIYDNSAEYAVMYKKFCDVVGAVRGAKSQNGFSMKKPIEKISLPVEYKTLETDARNVLNITGEIIWGDAADVESIVWGE